jgi:hypothetical protein
MLRLHIANSPNGDVASVREDAVEGCYAVSSTPQRFTVVVMDSGTTYNVTETVEEIEAALAKKV